MLPSYETLPNYQVIKLTNYYEKTLLGANLAHVPIILRSAFMEREKRIFFLHLFVKHTNIQTNYLAKKREHLFVLQI